MTVSSCQLVLPFALAGAIGALAQQMDKSDELWLEREVSALITEEERRLYQELPSGGDRERFRNIFWARRDPDPRTPENELREEFEGLLAIADQRFRARVGPGSRSEMGQVFLVLGFPASVATGRSVVALEPGREGGIPESLEGSGSEVAPPGESGASQAMGDLGNQRTQTWIYPPDEALGIPDGLEVKFRAQPGYGYRLVKTDQVERLLEARRQGLVTRPEIGYHLDPRGGLLPPATDPPSSASARLLDELIASGGGGGDVSFLVTPAFFRSREDTVYVPLLFELEEQALSFQGESASVTFFGAIADDGGIRHRFEERTTLPRGGPTFEIPLQLPTGIYSVYLGVLDEVSGRYGSRTTSLEVAPFDSKGLTTSSVVLHAGAEKTEEPAGVPGRAFQFGGIDLAPRARRAFARRESLGIFFYVYGAEDDPANGGTRLTVRYRFYRDQEEAAQTRPRSLTASGGQGFASDEIPLASFEPGDYQVLIQVTDEVAGKSLERKVGFRLEP